MKTPKVLLIEDDPDQISLYRTVFKLAGLKLLEATNGSKGLAAAKKNKPDLILCDLVMDGMDGMEVLKRLKADSATKNIPTVMLTNLNKKSLYVEAENLGALDFWAKTEVMPQEIITRVQKIIS
ncbi:MAG TPA: response regulator [bacterium]|nr:response regulator [bacterium]HNS33936.1 response regulator [bacterium]HPN81141.1 response regulator [bacterium]HPW39315.1 response regulator [bacterium]